MTLQETIIKHGLEKVKVQFTGESYFHNENAICSLEKYWENDNYNEYVHKIKLINDIPQTIKTIASMSTVENSHSYYMCDIEQIIKSGDAKIIILE